MSTGLMQRMYILRIAIIKRTSCKENLVWLKYYDILLYNVHKIIDNQYNNDVCTACDAINMLISGVRNVVLCVGVVKLYFKWRAILDYGSFDFMFCNGIVKP